MSRLVELLANATIIWAYMGLGPVVRLGKNHAANIEEILRDTVPESPVAELRKAFR